MAHKGLRESEVDTESAQAYFKTDRLRHMEDFLSVTNVTGFLVVGEKRFEGELYHVVEFLFTSIPNWTRLATTLIYLEENQACHRECGKAGNIQSVGFVPSFPCH